MVACFVFISWFLVDVLVYVVVLNLADEWVDDIKMKRFTHSLFTAVVLKLILEAIQYVEHEIQHFFCVKLERKVIGGFLMWLVVFSSKFLFLWLDDFMFGDQVELGYIWEIIVLSAVLIATEKINRILFHKLGDWYKARHPDAENENKYGSEEAGDGEDVKEVIENAEQGTTEEQGET